MPPFWHGTREFAVAIGRTTLICLMTGGHMIRGLLFIFGILVAFPLGATDGTESLTDEVIIGEMDTDLSEFLWKKRLLVVFADSEADPRFIQQMDKVQDRLADLAERDVVVLT